MTSWRDGAVAPVADAGAGNWVDRYAPAPLRPYLRLARADRPIGSWLLLLPCWWSTALAAIAAGQTYPNPWLLTLFAVGAVAMRGAGCTWNDILDRDIDRQVARTRNRPLASGQLGLKAAFAFLAFQLAVGVAVLLSLPRFAIVTGIASLGVVAIYPLMKRITSVPQVILGIAFSWGALMGWASVFRSIDDPALLLFAGSVCWVFGYDTIYAQQDKEDDALVGVGSTALLFGAHSRLAIALAYCACVLLFGCALASAGAGLLAALGLIGFAVLLYRQVKRLDIADGTLCLVLFKSNRDAGLILFAGLCADALLQRAVSAGLI
ncbi:4-hydroxybenzoate octaprenyltransferase [Aquabacter spiritensis]|uniref:4-hydroxybenzoate octaprenyltransferase n=1 Tax=Aquabacter spiritensis TaxID=933073 RepID=A0A4R3LR95_9HYPH|nr:4-hydroxybenzoate octaprenyltransferase [Aquabacter spiritensis]TCT02920.1 4-hydroxybenzoate polyprenyltransferase [Aquabacter spiritensis]